MLYIFPGNDIHTITGYGRCSWRKVWYIKMYCIEKAVPKLLYINSTAVISFGTLMELLMFHKLSCSIVPCKVFAKHGISLCKLCAIALILWNDAELNYGLCSESDMTMTLWSTVTYCNDGLWYFIRHLYQCHVQLHSSDTLFYSACMAVLYVVTATSKNTSRPLENCQHQQRYV